MSKGLLGKKLGMTGIYLPDGRYVPVTVLKVGHCAVTQIKTEGTDGYNALQVGFIDQKKDRVNKPLLGHFKKSGERCFSHVREFGVENPDNYTLGQTIDTNIFKIGERVDISGITKGRGFSGVIKRHGFSGGKDTHGCMSHRVPGSVGASAWPSRVVKGKKLPGHYGAEKQTIKNLLIVDIYPEENILLIKGAVPGAQSGLVEIKKISISK